MKVPKVSEYWENIFAFKTGIGGEKCDQCARGFIQDALLTVEHPVHDRQIPHGEMPMCLPCGECFTNWERILAELRNQTDEQIAKAEQVRRVSPLSSHSLGMFLFSKNKK